MDGVIVAALVVVVIVVALYGSHEGATTVGAGFGSLFSGWRGDPWPHGVQEEDRDQRWGAGRGIGGARDDAGPTAPDGELIDLPPQGDGEAPTQPVTATRVRARH
jgi:hypothetical protein